MKLPQIRTWPFWDLIFPPCCEACGAELSAGFTLYCAQCWTDAPRVDARDLPKFRYVDHVAAVYAFRDGNLVQAAVHALKYDGYTRVGTEIAKRMLPRMPERFRDAGLAWTPVPQHWKRRMTRTFNQSEFLARELARELQHAEPAHHLARVRHTPTQTARAYRERVNNVRGAFAVSNQKELPKAVLLIDDVITTGATVNECARTLKAAGVEWVGAFAFALAGLSEKGK